ncbi:unnamed protein product [Triticum turgidum subsp. durum]|uniref:Uncharacterized protein n=1 Tax=Triticum turgidum subsp. durum TaxID=4567 RepID=A0A9R1QJZ4_TRITD|nr:unnamed protein product [Triticum turgidum subsp. durum]
MEAAMDGGSVRATMSIFGESISGRKADKNRAQENLSSEMKQRAKSDMDKLNERKASVDNERAGAESELSRARAMAKELERQIDQTKAKATSQRSELQATWTRKNGAEEASDAQYAEVSQELDRVNRELRKLKLEVKSAAEAKAKAESDVVATAERFAREIEAARAKVKEARREVSRARELEAKLEATNADVEVLQGEMELVRAMGKNHVPNDGAAEDTTRQKKEEGQDRALLQAAEAELSMAKNELESIKAGAFQFMTSMDRTRTEIMGAVQEIDRLKAQEKNADAQVQQLNAKLLKARAQMEAVTAADERSKAIVSNLTAAMQQLHAETEAASKEEELTMLEKRCVLAEADNVAAEMATAEERIRQSVKELEAAKASEASAMKKLKAAVESTMQARAAAAPRRQGTITVSRFEYEYLSGRAALVRVVADKKVAAAQAWVQALKASEKEVAMRAEAAEREMREMGPREAQVASEAEKTAGEQKALEQELYDLNATAESVGLQCAYPRRRSSRVSATSKRSKGRRSSVSAANWNPKSPSFTIKRKKKMMPSLLKLIKEKRGGSDKSTS